MFSVPEAIAVSENKDRTSVCATLKATPETAVIANEVVVGLSSVDGTGKEMKSSS